MLFSVAKQNTLEQAIFSGCLERFASFDVKIWLWKWPISERITSIKLVCKFIKFAFSASGSLESISYRNFRSIWFVDTVLYRILQCLVALSVPKSIPTAASRRASPHFAATRRAFPPENRTLVLYRKKRGLGHLGEQEGVQEGSGRPFRLVKYRVFERFCVQRHVI